MKTVIVVGSGASAELSLPTGEKLKQQISALFRPSLDGTSIQDPQLAEIAYSFMFRGTLRHQRLTRAAFQIAEALPLAISIDNFLDAHREDEDIRLMGKIAIVRTILEAERNSPLYTENGRPAVEFEKLATTWYVKFFRLLVENCRVDDLPERFKQLRLVVFNYDRCIERFLILALMRYFNIEADRAVELLAAIELVHPYGVVGTFGGKEPELRTAYGGNPDSRQLLLLADQIRTFTEGVSEGEYRGRLTLEDLSNVRRIVFLGFAYHELNMKFLFPKEVLDQYPPGIKPFVCLGTAHGISSSDIELLDKSLRVRLRNVSDVRLSPNRCTDFLDEHWRRLSFVEVE